MDAKVSWQRRLSFTCEADSGFTLPLGAELSVGGDNDGFRPMELILTGLAGCTAMDVISILNKKRQEVTDFQVKVHAERAEEHPRVFTDVSIDYFIIGHGIDENAVIRAIELSAIRYCPAQAMFSKIIPIALNYHIYEDEGAGRRKLVKSGTYQSPVEATKT